MISLIKEDPVILLLLIPTILISLTFHELAHGYIAYKCGDETARNMGRLSLNPIRHLDLYGTLMMLFIGFGWAKPVPVNFRNFRKPRRDIFLVSIAGVTINIIFAFIGTILYFILLYVFLKSSELSFATNYIFNALEYPLVLYKQAELFAGLESIQVVILQFLALFTSLNVGLAVFNLLPIPPLDGSKILSVTLPRMLAAKYLRIEHYTRYIFLGLIFLSYVNPVISEYFWWPVQYLKSSILLLFQNLMTSLL
ncbi:MAG: hypothetical protein A2Y15_01290 [Clostridiales bacterium GWF2_36_10]|nr:MAG: hypothetical protein A2Y15_01290 [Clostridiales bacterium GWF2_36_10]HAN22036.1 site-2 protease family protein [Clostridiales bacterium]